MFGFGVNFLFICSLNLGCFFFFSYVEDIGFVQFYLFLNCFLESMLGDLDLYSYYFFGYLEFDYKCLKRLKKNVLFIFWQYNLFYFFKK